jgi:hypothetical protein
LEELKFDLNLSYNALPNPDVVYNDDVDVVDQDRSAVGGDDNIMIGEENPQNRLECNEVEEIKHDPTSPSNSNNLGPHSDIYIPPKASSVLWNHAYLKKIDGVEKVFCAFPGCTHTFDNNGGGSVRQHLNKKHIGWMREEPTNPIIQERNKKIRKRSENGAGDRISNEDSVIQEPSTKTRKTFIQTTISSHTVHKVGSKVYEQNTNALLYLICSCLLPWAFVESHGYEVYRKITTPHYVSPKATAITDRLFIFYDLTKQALKKMLSEASIDHFAITCDGWTSKMGDRFIAVTVHGMDVFMNRMSRVLEVVEVPEEHTIDNLCRRILEVLDYYGIKEKVWLGITDNAQNEAGAIAKAGLEWEPCVVHTLDLTLKHAATAAEDSISCARNLAAKIRMSKMKHDLKRIPEVKTTVKGWSKTRFYGMTEMLQSLVQIKPEISMVVLKYNENKAENEQVIFPSDREWNIINELLALWEPFAKVERKLSAENFLTASMVFPIIRGLDKHLRTFVCRNIEVEEVKTVMIEDLCTRWEDMGYRYTNSVILDPRFKLRMFDSDNYTIACENLKEEFDLLPVPASERPHYQNQALSNNSLMDIFDFDDSMLNGAPQSLYDEDDSKIYIPEKEWQRFLAEPNFDMNTDPDRWWRNKKEMYPRISKLYRKYNGAVVSSIPCERVSF